MRFRYRMSGARRFEELVSWQRGHELHVEVWKACERSHVSRDFDFKNQIRDASESVARNVAEGFGRYSPAQFLNFLDVSRASALETKSLLKKGLAVGYWDEKEFKRLINLRHARFRLSQDFNDI
jgi:four helix bundle protein